MKNLFDLFSPIMNFLRWIVNLIQLLIWSFGVVRKKNRTIESKESKIETLRNEMADLKDSLEKCKQVATHAVSVLRERAPKIHMEFVEEYSEEAILPEWVLTPIRSSKIRKK